MKRKLDWYKVGTIVIYFLLGFIFGCIFNKPEMILWVLFGFIFAFIFKEIKMLFKDIIRIL